MSGWWAASYAVLWAVVCILCVIVVALARQIGTLHLRLGPRGALELDDEGPPLGEAPPPSTTIALDGRETTIGGFSQGQLVVFASPGCRVCGEVIPALDVVAERAALDPILVTDVDREETSLAYRDTALRAPIVAGKDLVGSYSVPGTPYALVFDGTGIVLAKGTINNLEQLEGLVDTAARRGTATAAHA